MIRLPDFFEKGYRYCFPVDYHRTTKNPPPHIASHIVSNAAPYNERWPLPRFRGQQSHSNYSYSNPLEALRRLSAGFVPTLPREVRRTASFLSGGVDALSLLRSNRLEYPENHPRHISDCLLVFGLNSFDFDSTGFKRDRIESFEMHLNRMGEFANGAGATLIPATSNVRTFYPDFATWGSVGFAAGIISVALCFGSRFDVVELASVGLGTACPPGGTHPLLDEQFSTEAVQVRHAQPALSRMDKVRSVAAWPEALTVLRSCFYHTIPEGINCGKCEKCVRTMLALLAVGKLEDATSFPGNDVTPEMLGSFELEREDTRRYYEQIADAFEGSGRPDLVAVIRRKVELSRK